MANSKQAAKRAKQAAKQRTANMGLRTTLRTASGTIIAASMQRVLSLSAP